MRKNILLLYFIFAIMFLTACNGLHHDLKKTTDVPTLSETSREGTESMLLATPSVTDGTVTDETSTDAAETIKTVENEMTEIPETTTLLDETETTTETASTETEIAETTAVQISNEVIYPIRYEDSGVTITINKQWYVGAWCYVAHIQASDYSRLKTGMTNDAYGVHSTASSFAAAHNALLTVNGDYAEGEGKGAIRNGRIYHSDDRTQQAVYSQSTGILESGQGRTIAELAQMGYTDTFNFGANDLVVEGKSVYLRKDGGKSAQRTLIGTTGTPGDIYLVVTEGRYSDGVSRGLQYWEAGDLLESLGCYYGIALDGGGSSTMVWNGKVLNHTSERSLTGFVYIPKN